MNTIADQVKKALSARSKTTQDLADMLQLSLRQTQQRLKDNNITSAQLDVIADQLDWQFIVDPYGRTSARAGEVQDHQAHYGNGSPKPLSFSINLDRTTARKLPGLVEELEDVIKRRMSE